VKKLSGAANRRAAFSFLKVYDQVANVVKERWQTRRAAKMNTLKDWPSGHRGVHRGEAAEGREKSLGA